MLHRHRSVLSKYSRAFLTSCRIMEIDDRLQRGVPARARSALIRDLRRLHAKITPPKTSFAARARAPIVTACTAYFRQFGAPTNFRDLFRWLETQGVLSGTTADGKRWTVSETKLRVILHDVFGLYGANKRKSL